MIIYLYGSDSYRRQEKLKEIVLSYKGKHSGLNLNYFDLEEDGKFLQFKDFIKTNSLFDDYKLAIVRNCDFLEKNNLKELLVLLKIVKDDQKIILTINEEKKLPKDFGFLLKDPVISQEFDSLEGAEWQRFFWREAKKRNLVFDTDSKELLMRVYAGNSWGLITELDKLVLLGNKNITKNILIKHFNDLPALDIFYALNKIRESQRVGSRLAVFEELLSRSYDSAMIFNMMAASPYLTDSEKIKMADYDSLIKSGKLEYEEVLLSVCLG